jgi:WD40 repeat protein
MVNCGDCIIKALNPQTLQLQNMVLLPALAIDFFYIHKLNCFVVLTVDGNLHIYNLNNLQQPITYKLPGYPLAADISGELMIIAMNQNMISAFNINLLFNNFNGNFNPQFNMLESPVSKIKLNIPNQTFISASIDSRVISSIFSLHNNGIIEIPKNKEAGKTFLFMAHGIKPPKNSPSIMGHAYNINSVNLHPHEKTFMASGSADGVVVFWDLHAKSKICTFEFRESLSCGTISKSGKFAAYAIGYDWSKAYWDISMAPKKPTIATLVINQSFLKYKK